MDKRRMRIWVKNKKQMIPMYGISEVIADAVRSDVNTLSKGVKHIFNNFYRDVEVMWQIGLRDKSGAYLYFKDIVEFKVGKVWKRGVIVFEDGAVFIKVENDTKKYYLPEVGNYQGTRLTNIKCLGNQFEHEDKLHDS